jgi:hypothetical protein
LAEEGRSVHLFTYGSPRVGDPEFYDWFTKYTKITHFRVVNNHDTVPHVYYNFKCSFLCMLWDSIIKIEKSGIMMEHIQFVQPPEEKIRLAHTQLKLLPMLITVPTLD